MSGKALVRLTFSRGFLKIIIVSAVTVVDTLRKNCISHLKNNKIVCLLDSLVIIIIVAFTSLSPTWLLAVTSKMYS